MLQSTRVTQTGLERGLAELETLGLIRPSNVLLAEYLRALTAEDVLDIATADQISAAYNRRAVLGRFRRRSAGVRGDRRARSGRGPRRRDDRAKSA